MNRSHCTRWVFGLLTMFALASWVTPQEPSAPTKDDVVLQNPIEVQTRGPLHEAFAQPFDVKPAPGTLIPKEPPPPIREEPPEEKPAAENAQWVPGYWAWDAQRQEFMWVSGVYRVPPQDRTFIPGYWQHTADGWRWVSGFWSDARQEQLPYTPEPPAPLDNGPSMPQPDDDSTYIPGAWIYRDSRFVWRAGYYAAVQDGRVWVPPRYVWTPRGYLFVNGYWDYPLESRGLVFAPVYFSQPLWNDPSWRYRPQYVVNPDAFFDSAFVGPLGFYFGNYYDPLYARAGFRPWYTGAGRYDPLFTHHGWQNHRTNRNWVGGVQTVYGNRTSGRVAVPPVTLAAHNTLANARTSSQPFVFPIVTPVNQFTSKKANVVRATPSQLAKQQTLAQGTRIVAQNRSQFDSAIASKNAPSNAFRAAEIRSPSLPTQAGLAPRTTIQASPKITSSAATPRVVTSAAPVHVTRTPTTTKSAPIVTHTTPQVHRVAPAPIVTHTTPQQVHRIAPAPARVSTPARSVYHPPARTTSSSSRPATNNRKR